ncbi:MAG: hypothetical protein KJ052_10585 [Candidatus Hydrogenedentes bacterium]|nr:hypothetical protein [Candidatus Hydrogenedentota bacterium]
MASELAKCRNCGKLFSTMPGKHHCAQCTAQRVASMHAVEEAVERWQLKKPEDIAAFAGVSVEEASKLMRESSNLEYRLQLRKPCKRCTTNLAQPNQEYCLDCRIELNIEFTGVVNDLEDRMHRETVVEDLSAAAPNEVLSTLNRKRGHSAVGRLDPTPRGRYRQ